MKPQELLNRCREMNLRSGDIVRVKFTDSDVNALTRLQDITEIETTFIQDGMGWNYYNRYGERKRTQSTGESIRCCSIYLRFTTKNGKGVIDSVDASKIESIEVVTDTSRRRKNDWLNIEDYETVEEAVTVIEEKEEKKGENKMELNLFLIDNIEDHEEAYVKFKTGKRCWTWDDQVEAIVTMTEGFDLYLDDMTEEERNDMDEIDIAKTRFALNQMENWKYLYEDDRDERKAFSRWLQIEQHGTFTIEQVAEATGKSPATIRNKIKKLGIKKPNQNGNKFGKWEFCKDEFEHLVLLIKAL